MTTDDPVTDRMVEEMKTLAPCEIVFRPESLLKLVSMVQLATRHPNIPNSLRASAATFIGGACEYFARCPTVLDVIRAGDDPRQDVIIPMLPTRVQ